MQVRAGTTADNELIADHYLALWATYETPSEAYLPDARERILRFLAHGLSELKLRTFVATAGERIMGSAGCHLRPEVYPTVVRPSHRNAGYIWQVYVLPEFRGKGAGRALTSACVDYFRTVGCTVATLHYSEAGEQLYRSMGFEQGNELRLALL